MASRVSTFRPDSSLVAEVRPSPNHGERKLSGKPDMIVLHYTGMSDTDAALAKLCAAGTDVSAHYVVMENGHIVQCVPEERRAWHAGAASWEGETDVNSCSIGIEIANPGHSHGYPNFPKRQIAAVIMLCRSILTRHRIPPWRVLGHSDVAPNRKKDPGEKFPWDALYKAGIGLWVKAAPVVVGGPLFVLGEKDQTIREVQERLSKYGYDVPISGDYDGQTRDVVAAFQRHFRPARVDGVVDTSTIVTIGALSAARAAVSD
ncbi:MAG TPA: N-acetylmuramoyl-L-alanine amidase [Xanthobacteraceae bacterium]|nr:N-acetylmuramoyl-L-alanine amidase [Xanthobacteraceae bacterium]